MSVRKFTETLLNDAIRLNIEGMNVGEIAKRFEVSRDNLSSKLRRREYKLIRHHRVAANAKDFPKQEAIELFLSGKSIKFLAAKYGVQRKTISDHLIRNGIEPRNRSEAMLTRMAFTPKEERERLTKAAHDAVRGKPQSREFREKMSISRQGIEKFIGFGEKELQESLIDRGFDAILQVPFEGYNIDLVVNGTVAVEVLKSGSSPFIREKNIKKTKKLLEAGYSVFWILWLREDELIVNFENIIADIAVLCGNPASSGKYRVVKCTSKRFARFKDERGCFAAIPSPVKFFYTDRTKDFCIPE